jgi:hypothetical protein
MATIQEAPTRVPFVFACYAHDDETQICSHLMWLQERDIECWYDRGIRVGTIWVDEIAQALNRATHVLFFVSRASMASSHCSRELLYAVDHGKQVIPVFLEDIELTPGLSVSLSRVQALMAHRLETRDVRTKLLEAITRGNSPVVGEPTSRVTPPRPTRRVWFVPLAGALLVVAAGVGISNTTAAQVWLALNIAPILSRPIEQHIGFATTTDGVKIAYASSGSGPPLVTAVGWFTHLTEGLGSPGYDSAGLIRWLSRDHRVVRYDGRGFGLSDREVTDFSYEMRVRDLEAVVDALDLQRFVLCGQSGGVLTVLRYIDRHPERVSRLMLLGQELSLLFLCHPTSVRKITSISCSNSRARVGKIRPRAPRSPSGSIRTRTKSSGGS